LATARNAPPPHLGLFALDVNAEPSAPLWRPRRNGERHQGEQRFLE
jgi:hypothetical protein